MKKYIRRALTAMVAAAVLVTSSGVMTLADSIQAEPAETGTSETTEGIPAETVPANETEPVTDGEGDTGTGQVPDKEPSDGQTSGGQTPEEGNSDGEIETPEEAVYASLTTGVYAEDREGTRSAVKEVLVRLYDAGTYDADAETNPVLAELSIDEEETGTLPELTPGEYRIEYVIRNEQFPAEKYEGKELPEGTDYKVLLAEDEAAADAAAGKPEKERDYFAVIPSIQLT